MKHIVSFTIQTVLSALESHQVSPAMQESRAIPPVGNRTPPQRYLYSFVNRYHTRFGFICKALVSWDEKGEGGFVTLAMTDGSVSYVILSVIVCDPDDTPVTGIYRISIVLPTMLVAFMVVAVHVVQVVVP